MGMIRNYQLLINVNKKCVAKNEYFTEDSAINDMLEILSNNNLMRLADKGEFPITTTQLISEKTFQKRYTIAVDIPPMEITIYKKSKGDINQAVFLEKVEIYRSKYERKNY